jgi:hypothetical protein
VSFRKIAARIVRALGRGVAVLLAFSLVAPMGLQAQPGPKEALAEVLKDPEFQVKKRKKGLHWKDQKEPEKEQSLPDLAGFFKLLGTFAKWVVIVMALTAVVYVLWRNRKYLARRLRVASDSGLSETLFGMDIRPEFLPKGLEVVAARLWAEGQIREALALLYRGALVHLVYRHPAPLFKGSTEGDCLRKAHETLPQPSADYFGRLTRTWLEVAYADLDPTPGSVSLCLEWHTHFRDTPDEVRR